MRTTLTFIALMLSTLILIACEQGPAEEAGEEIDEAVEEVADEAEDACEEAKEATGAEDTDC